MITVILATEHAGKPAGSAVQLDPTLAHRLIYLGHARPAEKNPPAKATAKEATK